MNCYRCAEPVGANPHPAAPSQPGGAVDWACHSCYQKLMEFVARPRTLPPCDGCGAEFGTGCVCRANGRAIGRGERREP